MSRLMTLSTDFVLSRIFTKDVRRKLSGELYTSPNWINASKLRISIPDNEIEVSLGSHTLQTFANDGIVCRKCGVVGSYFTVDSNSYGHYYLNLFAEKQGRHILMTKDHIIPRCRGGRNSIDNYQTLCKECNAEKGRND